VSWPRSASSEAHFEEEQIAAVACRPARHLRGDTIHDDTAQGGRRRVARRQAGKATMQRLFTAIAWLLLLLIVVDAVSASIGVGLAFIDKNGGGPGYLGPVTTLCTKIRWVSAALTPCVNGRHRSNFFGGFAMLPELRALHEDEPCPVLDETLGEMYRASAHGLSQIITTISPAARVLLAIYCYRRAHLASMGIGDRGNLRERRSDVVGRQRGCRAVRAIA